MKIRKVLYADEGKVLTDGNTYAIVIYLAETASEKDFCEITEEEYNKRMAENDNEVM